LNAAIKLNDWAFHRYQHEKKPEILSLYLSALQAQETAIQELLR
jgi:hypothetical protein